MNVPRRLPERPAPTAAETRMSLESTLSLEKRSATRSGKPWPFRAPARAYLSKPTRGAVAQQEVVSAHTDSATVVTRHAGEDLV
jgi:hypothetical protein